MAPAAAPASRSAGLGRVFGGVVDGLLPPGGGPPQTALLERGEAGADDEALDEPPAAAVTADRDQLEYARLWMPPADDPRRGRLRRVDQAQRYGRLADLAPEQVAAALGRARVGRTRAEQLERRHAPAGHRWGRAADGFDYAYPAEARVSLDSDGELHGLALRSPEVTATPRYICVPQKTPDVFRVIALRNPIDAPLLPGPVDVYLGGRFALAASLELTPPRGRVELGLGVEPGIKVARNLAFDEGAAGLLKRHRDLEHRLQVDVRNNLAQPATVEVRERVPVTAEEEGDIELEERAVEPPWDELRGPLDEEPPLRGGRVWAVEVPAGAERTLRATYCIRIPQGHELVGGNRRHG